MAITPQEFFSRNCKWFLLVFVILFLFKTMQSCNRNMKLNITSGQYIHMIDSLKKDYSKLEKESNTTINQLKFELKLANEKADASENKAKAVISVAEKIRANTTTTINVKGAEIDTIKRK